MPKITEALPDAVFEALRDKIASILKDEIPNQATLKARPELNATVYTEREAAFSSAELPAITVALVSGANDQRNWQNEAYTYSFNIDVHAKGAATAADRGELVSQRVAQSLVNLVRAILSHSVYRYLDLTRGVVTEHYFGDFTLFSNKAEDSDHVALARLTYTVKANELDGTTTPETYAGADSRSDIDSTDKGYNYTDNA